jgi:hypothetical protein
MRSAVGWASRVRAFPLAHCELLRLRCVLRLRLALLPTNCFAERGTCVMKSTSMVSSTASSSGVGVGH